MHARALQTRLKARVSAEALCHRMGGWRSCAPSFILNPCICKEKKRQAIYIYTPELRTPAMDPCEYLHLMQPLLSYLREQNGGGTLPQQGDEGSGGWVAAAALAVALVHFTLASVRHYAARRWRR